jgi:hypothetical protein
MEKLLKNEHKNLIKRGKRKDYNILKKFIDSFPFTMNYNSSPISKLQIDLSPLEIINHKQRIFKANMISHENISQEKYTCN